MTFKERVTKILSNVWSYIKIARVELIVLVALFAVDLVVKAAIDANMYVGQVIPVIPNFFSIHYTRNKNAAFGSAFGLENVLGELGVRIVLLIITGAAIVFFAVFMYKTKGKHITGRLGLAMLISGALGNFVDRAVFGYVRDFAEIIYFGLDLPFIGSSFAIFNIADVGVTVGVVLFLIYIIFFFVKEKEAEADKESEKSEYVIIDVSDEKAAETTPDVHGETTEGDTP